MELYVFNILIVVYLIFNRTKKFNLPYALGKIVPDDASDYVIGAIALVALLFPFAALLLVLATYYSNDKEEKNETDSSVNEEHSGDRK